MPLWLFGFTLERLCAKTRLNQPEASVGRWQLASRERRTSCRAATSTGCSLSVCPCSRARITAQWQTQHSLGCRDELPSVHADGKTPKETYLCGGQAGETTFNSGFVIGHWERDSVKVYDSRNKCGWYHWVHFQYHTKWHPQVVLLVPIVFCFFLLKLNFLLEGNIEN